MSLSFSDKVLLDASEFVNAVYEDMSQINEILTLKDPSLMIEGVILWYKGYPVVCSLEDMYRRPLTRLANLYDLHDKLEEESVIDYFYVKNRTPRDGPEAEGALDLSVELSEEGNEESMREIIEIEISSKQNCDLQEGEGDKQSDGKKSEISEVKKRILEIGFLTKKEDS